MANFLAYRNPQKSYMGREQMAESSSYRYQGNSPFSGSTKLDVSSLQCSKVEGLQIQKNFTIQRDVVLPAKPSRVVGKDDLGVDYKKHVVSGKADSPSRQLYSANVKITSKEVKSQNLAANGASSRASCHSMPHGSNPVWKVGKEISESGSLPGGHQGVDNFSSCKSRSLTDRSAPVEQESPTEKIKMSGPSKHKIQEKNVISREVHSIKDQYQLKVNGDKTGRGYDFPESNKSRAAPNVARALSRALKLNSAADVSHAPSSSKVLGSHRKLLLETLRHFEKLYLKVLQEEKRKSKGQTPNPYCICIKASKILKDEGKWINSDRDIGNVPGIEIGDKFQYRAELAVVGLHHNLFCGISYAQFRNKTCAISIVNSGRYGNVTKSSDVFIYTGEGGNPKVSKKKAKDQKMKRGNLALKNSMVDKLPVRVIHSRKIHKPFDTLGMSNGKGEVYVYDGLYTVNGCQEVRDQCGKLAFKFEMRRLVDSTALKGAGAGASAETVNW